jgi:hypothetical protein
LQEGLSDGLFLTFEDFEFRAAFTTFVVDRACRSCRYICVIHQIPLKNAKNYKMKVFFQATLLQQVNCCSVMPVFLTKAPPLLHHAADGAQPVYVLGGTTAVPKIGQFSECQQMEKCGAKFKILKCSKQNHQTNLPAKYFKMAKHFSSVF